MADLTFIFMDAGQGDSTLIIYPDSSITMIDCGSTKNGPLVANEITTVLRTYLPANKNKIDNLIVTHPDQDHYNLLKDVIITPKIPVDHVYYGGDINEYKNQPESNATYNWLSSHKNCASPPATFGGAKPDAALSRAGVAVYALAANAISGPPAAGPSPAKRGRVSVTPHDRNGDSIVLLVEYKRRKVFLMGDATSKTEDFIIRSCTGGYASLLQNTGEVLLKLGHHGSDTSSSQAWVQALTPNILMISADSRHFGASGKGMPAKAHLQKVEAWSGKVLTFPTQNHCHPYVIYHDDKADPDYQKFTAEGPTRKAICTTLYEIKYDRTGTNFDATGGSWYYYIKPNGATAVAFTGWNTSTWTPCP